MLKFNYYILVYGARWLLMLDNNSIIIIIIIIV
jgi:hypothetical protein